MWGSRPSLGVQSPSLEVKVLGGGLGRGVGGPSAGRGLTQQQQLHLPRRLLSVFPQVPVDHLGALGRRLVFGAHGAAHPAVRRPGRRPAPTRPPARLGPVRDPLRSRRRLSSGSSRVGNCERLRAVPSRPSRTDGGAGRRWGRNEPGPGLCRGGFVGGAMGDPGPVIGSRAGLEAEPPPRESRRGIAKPRGIGLRAGCRRGRAPIGCRAPGAQPNDAAGGSCSLRVEIWCTLRAEQEAAL